MHTPIETWIVQEDIDCINNPTAIEVCDRKSNNKLVNYI